MTAHLAYKHGIWTPNNKAKPKHIINIPKPAVLPRAVLGRLDLHVAANHSVRVMVYNELHEGSLISAADGVLHGLEL